MPITECELDGKAGFKYGASGTCYTHDGTEAGKAAARKKAIKQAIAIGGGSAPRDLEAADLRLLEDDLQTEDFNDVELMRVGGPVHAIGSPPEGDHWTKDHLRQMADAAAELADQLRPPNKIGHSPKQRLLLNSGVSDGERPAAGWLDNIRLTDDGERLLADVRAVPKTIARLIRAGAWRTRSAELSKVTSQKTGKTYDWVVTGLAWLGEKMPSIHSLDDVVRLYEDADGVELRCVVERENEDANGREAFEVLRELAFEAAAGISARAADSPAMPDLTLTGEQQKELADSLGLKADEISVEKLLEAAKATKDGEPEEGAQTEEQATELAKSLGVEGEVTPEKLLEAAKAKAEEDPERKNEAEGELKRELEEVKKSAAETAEELRIERRRHFVEDELIGTGKIEPGQRVKWERRYDENPEMARSFAEDLKPDEELLRELGSDEDGDGDEKTEMQRAFEEDLARREGVKVEELI